MHRHRQRQHRTRPQHEIFAAENDSSGTGIRCEASREQVAQIGVLPMVHCELVVRLGERDQAAFETLTESSRGVGPARGLRGQ